MYKIRPIGRDEEGHPQGARYAGRVLSPLHTESIIFYIDFEVEVTDEWESSRDMPGGWDYQMSNLRLWRGMHAVNYRVLWSTSLVRELELSVHQYIEDNPE